jgi:hypothetical protein
MFSVAAYVLFAGAIGIFLMDAPEPSQAQVVVPPSPAASSLRAFSNTTDTSPPPPWRVVGLPASKKPLTEFDIVNLGGERVLRVRADRSYANLSHRLPPNTTTATRLQWRWRLDVPLIGANLRTKNGDDNPVKVCALFDLPLESLGFIERNLLRLARNASGEHLPGATLCYVWDQKLPVGTELPNPFTRRVRYLVLNSASTPLQTWVSHSRDLHADFLRSFGHESSTVPPLLAIAVGADADNTAESSLAYVGDLTLVEQ